MSSTCQICCGNFNKSTQNCIKCEFADCNYEVCKTCVRQYLLSTTSDPHCMSCHKAWSQCFIVRKLNRSFITTDYKIHRKALLVDREISKLSEIMEDAEKRRKTIIEEVKAAKIRIEISKLKNSLKIYNDQLNNCYNNVRIINKVNCDKTQERKQFIMPCPSDNCKGLLSSQYKCGVCDKHTCSKCLEIIGDNKNIEHTCDENSVASAQFIKKDTKGCPSCGIRIHKISGCDQMWCPDCKSAFSWNTGKLDLGVVHNPHYYQFQRQINNGHVERTQDIHRCGVIPDLRRIFKPRLLDRIQDTKLSNNITAMHRLISHITFATIPETRAKINGYLNTKTFKIEYILNNKTKEELSNHIYRNDSTRRKFAELIHIYELLSTIGIENLNKMVNIDYQNIELFIEQVNQYVTEYDCLRIYCNKLFEEIGITYNVNVTQIDENWIESSRKYYVSNTTQSAQ